MSAQVYDYSAIKHEDTETNPAILASPGMNNRLQIFNQNTFSTKQPFSISSLKFSKYFESAFIGLGICANNTGMGNKTYYNDLGIRAAYCNVLFNVLYLKLGASYKFLNSNFYFRKF